MTVMVPLRHINVCIESDRQLTNVSGHPEPQAGLLQCRRRKPAWMINYEEAM